MVEVPVQGQSRTISRRNKWLAKKVGRYSHDGCFQTPITSIPNCFLQQSAEPTETFFCYDKFKNTFILNRIQTLLPRNSSFSLLRGSQLLAVCLSGWNRVFRISSVIAKHNCAQSCFPDMSNDIFLSVQTVALQENREVWLAGNLYFQLCL